MTVLFFSGCDDSISENRSDVVPDPSTTTTIDSANVLLTDLWSFKDRAVESGVNFTVRNGEGAGHFSILESLGSGLALVDFDSDGSLDVLIAGGGEFSASPHPRGLPSGLFQQTGLWEFRDGTVASRIPPPDFYSHGVLAGDYDSDGFVDALVTGYQGLQLLKNCGDGTFNDVTESSGLAGTTWSTGAAWGDFNGDGISDLYVVGYVDWSFKNHPACQFHGKRDVCSPKYFEAQSDVLWQGRGDGTFRDATQNSGLVAGGKGLAVIAADIDLDSDVDLYVANDTTPNFLYWNDGSGHFTEAGIVSGTGLGEHAEADGSMGVDIGDWNLDGHPDLWVANYENQSFALYRGQGDQLFEHSSSVSGITSVGQTYVGFGTVIRDFDLDGDEDIVAVNGHVMRHSINSPLRQSPLLFLNQKGQRFRNVAAHAGRYFQGGHVARGVAAGDIDGDGDSDLAVSHTNEPVALLENQRRPDSQPQPHWIRVRLVGVRSDRDAIGASIHLRTGDHRQLRLRSSGGSYLSSSEPASGFGFSIAAEEAQLEVTWTSGQAEKFSVDTCGGVLTIKEGMGYTFDKKPTIE